MTRRNVTLRASRLARMTNVLLASLMAVVGLSVIDMSIARAGEPGLIDPPARAIRWCGSIRVLTWNIQHGENLQGTYNLQGIIDIIRKSGADIVALQDVDRSSSRTRNHFQADLLAQALGMNYVYGEAMEFTSGFWRTKGYNGNAILSKFPISENTNHPLPDYQQPWPASLPGAAIQHAKIRVDGQTINFFNTHYTHKDGNNRPIPAANMRYWQAKASARAMGTNSHVVFMGDLNVGDESPILSPLSPWLSLHRGDIDQIRISSPMYLSTMRDGRPTVAEIPGSKGPSDHEAVWADLKFPSAMTGVCEPRLVPIR